MAVPREDKTFYIKEGSSLPRLSAVLIDSATGQAVDLSSAVEVRVKISDDEMQILDTPADVDPDQVGSGRGKVYVDSALFSGRHGRYFAEFDVFWTSNRVPQTFPNSDYIYIIVTEDID